MRHHSVRLATLPLVRQLLLPSRRLLMAELQPMRGAVFASKNAGQLREILGEEMKRYSAQRLVCLKGGHINDTLIAQGERGALSPQRCR